MDTSAAQLRKPLFVIPGLRSLGYSVSVIAIVGFAASAICAEYQESALPIPANNPGLNASAARRDNLTITATSPHRAAGSAATRLAPPTAKKHGANYTSTCEAECIHKEHQRLRPNADDGASYLATF